MLTSVQATLQLVLGEYALVALVGTQGGDCIVCIGMLSTAELDATHACAMAGLAQASDHGMSCELSGLNLCRNMPKLTACSGCFLLTRTHCTRCS